METITRGELQTLIAMKGEYILIDVREKEELHNGMILTAQHIPLGEIEFAFALSEEAFFQKYGFAKPQQEMLIIFYCRTGGRSSVATACAEHQGFLHAKNYAGSIYDWAEIDPNVRRY